MYTVGRRMVQAAVAVFGVPVVAAGSTTTCHADVMTFDAVKKKRKKNRPDNIMLISGSGHPKLSKEVSDILKVPLADATLSRYADGEVDIKVNTQVRGKDIFYIQPCSSPSSDNIMELLLFISLCRRSGAKRVTAIIPYFPFKHRRLGTMSSTKYNSRFLSSSAMDFSIMLQEMGVDRVIAVDLQRPGQGQEACFFDNSIPLEVILTTKMMISYFVVNADRFFSDDRHIVVVAPNRECLKKALKFSVGVRKGLGRKKVDLMGFTHQGTSATNKGSGDKLDSLGEANMKNADVVIIDDFVDTGETIAALAKRFKAQGANKVYVCASHAICSEDSISLIDKSQVDVLVTTNSLPLPEACSSKIEQMSLGPLLSRVIWTEHFRSNLKNFEDEDDETKDLY